MRIIPVSLQLKNMEGTSSSFSFHTVTKENIAKLITNLDIKKAVQSVDIPTTLVKEFGCLFSSFIASNVNKCIKEGTYVDTFKKSEIRPLYKKEEEQKNQTIGPLVSFRMFQKFTKDACMIKFIVILVKYFQSISPVFVKVITHSISF